MQSLGIVTVAASGTPQRLTTNDIKCERISIQPLKAGGAQGTAPTPNTGYVYLLNNSTAKETTLANCVLALAIGADAFTLPVRGINLSSLYLDADNSGDGALISYA